MDNLKNFTIFLELNKARTKQGLDVAGLASEPTSHGAQSRLGQALGKEPHRFFEGPAVLRASIIIVSYK